MPPCQLLLLSFLNTKLYSCSMSHIFQSLSHFISWTLINASNCPILILLRPRSPLKKENLLALQDPESISFSLFPFVSPENQDLRENQCPSPTALQPLNSMPDIHTIHCSPLPFSHRPKTYRSGISWKAARPSIIGRACPHAILALPCLLISLPRERAYPHHSDPERQEQACHWTLVAHACNPSYLGDWDGEDRGMSLVK
jgi:hypothetical protein